MTKDKRDLYYTDYKNYRAAAKEAASAEYADEKADVEKALADSTDSALESTVDTAGNYGRDAAKAYIDNWNKAVQEMGLSFLRFPDLPENADNNGSTNNNTSKNKSKNNTNNDNSNTDSNTGNDGKNDKSGSSKGEGDTYISAKQPITINVAGIPVISTTISAILRANGLIGRANSKF